MKIELADLQDIGPILAVLHDHLIDINNPEIIQNYKGSGFLIRDFSPDQIKEIILAKTNNLVLTAKKDDELLGYLISSKFNKIPQDLQLGIETYLLSKQINLEKVIYHRQIAAKPGTKNIGNLLMLKFLEEAKNAGYQYVVCRIIHHPINNNKSILFHKKFGFSLIGEVNENGLVAGVYLKNLAE